MNEVYSTLWCPLQNHFCPNLKLKQKHRDGANVVKKYHAPQTPYQRVIAHPNIPESTKQALSEQHATLNPFTIKALIEQQLKLIFSHVQVTSNCEATTLTLRLLFSMRQYEPDIQNGNTKSSFDKQLFGYRLIFLVLILIKQSEPTYYTYEFYIPVFLIFCTREYCLNKANSSLDVKNISAKAILIRKNILGGKNMSTASIALTKLNDRIDANLIDKIVDIFYDKMLDDYSVNRFFSGKPITEQTRPLKVYLKSIFAGLNDPDQITDLLDDCFMGAFARTSNKSSHMGGDFDFLMEIAGGKDTRVLTFLCDAHSHFLKFKPDDFYYDAVMKHLNDTLKELNVSEDLNNDLLALAESARDGVLGRRAE